MNLDTAQNSSGLRQSAAGPLRGKHALVTGAGGGIGSAIVRKLAAYGASITMLGRRRSEDSPALMLELKALLLKRTSPCETVSADVSDEQQVLRAFDKARERFGPIAILVNNAGAAESASFIHTDPALWQRMLAVNLTGTYLCTRQALPEMLAARQGRIINIASTAGLTGYSYVSAYCAAKHGVVGLTRALAIETAQTGVTVNAICPGNTDTNMIAQATQNIAQRTGKSIEEARALLIGSNPQGRFVSPNEVASAVVWLCLPGSEAVTGQAIAVCGGEVMTG